MQEGEEAVGEGLGERGGRAAGEVGGGAAGCEVEVRDQEAEAGHFVRVVGATLLGAGFFSLLPCCGDGGGGGVFFSFSFCCALIVFFFFFFDGQIPRLVVGDVVRLQDLGADPAYGGRVAASYHGAAVGVG